MESPDVLPKDLFDNVNLFAIVELLTQKLREQTGNAAITRQTK